MDTEMLGAIADDIMTLRTMLHQHMGSYDATFLAGCAVPAIIVANVGSRGEFQPPGFDGQAYIYHGDNETLRQP